LQIGHDGAKMKIQSVRPSSPSVLALRLNPKY
jgi:hypothetical protein